MRVKKKYVVRTFQSQFYLLIIDKKKNPFTS